MIPREQLTQRIQIFWPRSALHKKAYLIRSFPLEFSEPLKKCCYPGADGCHLSLDNTSCLATCANFGRAFGALFRVDPYQES